MKMFSVDRTVYMMSAVKSARVSREEYSDSIVITFLDGTRVVVDNFLPDKGEEYQYLCDVFGINPVTGEPLI